MNKLGLTALSMAFLDILAIMVLGYVAVQSMNLIAWTFLLLLALVFSYDAYKAIEFVVKAFRK